MDNQNIYVTQPTLAPLGEVAEIMQKIWDSGIMTHNGPLVQQFEKETKDFLGCSNLVACTNGTIALQMAIKALETVQRIDDVLNVEGMTEIDVLDEIMEAVSEFKYDCGVSE